jgi:hypothetical protein
MSRDPFATNSLIGRPISWSRRYPVSRKLAPFTSTWRRELSSRTMAFRDCANASENRRARSPCTTTETVYHLGPFAGAHAEVRLRRRAVRVAEGERGVAPSALAPRHDAGGSVVPSLRGVLLVQTPIGLTRTERVPPPSPAPDTASVVCAQTWPAPLWVELRVAWGLREPPGRQQIRLPRPATPLRRRATGVMRYAGTPRTGRSTD